MKPIDRRTLVAGVGSGVAALAGCLDGRRGSVGGLGSGGGGTDEGDTSEAAGPAPPTVDRELPTTHSVAEMLEASQSGGPEPDGIPAIDDPTFAPATDPPGILDDGDPVFGVEIDGEAKAYPQSVLVWHEIVNDVVSETPVSVTYCPLTGTAQGFYRGDTTFGVSGQLINSNLVMFDRGTESWWPQLPAIRITGNDTGTYLREFRVVWTTWDRWRSAHPETVVLTDDTGFARDYGRDPYGGYNPPDGYYTSDSLVFPALTEDDRLARKEVVIGTRSEHGAAAVRKETLREERLVPIDVDGVDRLAVYDRELDTGYVYRPPAAETQSASWDDGRVTIDGEAYAPDQLPYERDLAFDAMWFAWYGYYPETVLYDET